MTLVKWDEAVRIAKIKLDEDPNSFTMVKGKLLKEAQMIYRLLLAGEEEKKKS
jgi:hypothetical protein